MPSFEIIALFFGSALLLGAAPGPDNIFVLTQSAVFGTRAGIATTFGLVTGLCFHTLAVACGVAALLAAFPLALFFLKCLGAAYLCWLAYLAFRAGASQATGSAGAFPGYWALYRRGVIMNVANPKVALFFLAFLPQFCSPNAGPMFWQITLFGFLFMLATIVVFCPVALLGGKLADWLNRSPKKQLMMRKISGIIFIMLATGLFLADVG